MPSSLGGISNSNVYSNNNNMASTASIAAAAAAIGAVPPPTRPPPVPPKRPATSDGEGDPVPLQISKTRSLGDGLYSSVDGEPEVAGSTMGGSS